MSRTDASVLLVSGLEEYGSNAVVDELTRRGVPLVRLNLDDEQPVHLDARLDHDGRWSGEVEQYGRSVSLRQISGIWCRSVHRPPGDPAIVDPDERAWTARQNHRALAGIVRTLPGRWINHPDRTSAASYKADQLVQAAQLGLRVPRTLITGSGQAAASWTAQLDRPALCKPFDPAGTLDHSWVPAAKITAPIPPEPLGAISIFQEIIHGAHIRVTVVGNQVFAAQITPLGDDLDWRMTQETADYTETDVPTSVHDNLVAALQRYGLVFGAFDLVVDADGVWWFLEINPVGQYVFVETRTKQPITKAIVDHLCPASASPDRAHTKWHRDRHALPDRADT